MALRNFIDGVGQVVLKANALGTPMTAIWLSPEAEKVILAAAARERCDELELTPRMKIHGVLVRVHEGMPTGHVWYVYQGGKS